MKSHLKTGLLSASAIVAIAGAFPAQAQTINYGGASGMSGGSEGDDSAAPDSDAEGTGQRQRRERHVEVSPYIDVAQVAVMQISPGSDVVTYSVAAAGVDASFHGRNNEGAVSLRYERSFGWNGSTQDSDRISGIARFSAAIVPNALTLEAGALAARTQVDGNGASVLEPLGSRGTSTQVYSVYAGPSVRTQAGDVAIEGHYRAGYTRLEAPDSVTVAPGQAPVDLFDEAVVHNAAIHAGTRAGEALPVGIGVGAGYQRIEDLHVRGDVTVPLTADLAAVGGVGWEHVQVSSRDAVIDTVTGLPVVGSDGRLVTDSSAPRQIAFESEGLIWDAGVMWRPSRRTALEAHVGRRYGSTTYYGSFAYAPDANSSLNVSVYDGITGFGGQMNTALAGLPTVFQAARNPLTGEIGGCVVSTQAGGCVSGALGSVRSAAFRSRGVMASYGRSMGHIQTGFGLGYDRRSFIGAPGTVLALANGVIDENYWVAAYLNADLDRNSSLATNFYSSWYHAGDVLSGDSSVIGASTAYRRNITTNLSATAALGVNGLQHDDLEDQWSASALVGVRYSF
jgi:hypothetical protein